MTENITNETATPGGDRIGEGRAGLRRPVDGRYLGGVAAGLARWFQIDPLLVRVTFVVLTLFGGTGLWLYAIIWLIVPEDGAPVSLLRLWLDRIDTTSGGRRVLWGAALAVGALIVLGGVAGRGGFAFGDSEGFRGIGWLIGRGLEVGLLVVIVLAVISFLSPQGRARSWRGAAGRFGYPWRPSSPAPTAAEDAAAASSAATGPAPAYGAAPAYGPAPACGPAPAYRPAPASAYSPSRPGGPPSGDAALIARLRPRRRRSPLGWLTIGIALATTAALSGLKATGHLSLSGLRIGAIALLVLALGLAVGAFVGWSRWLVVIAAALTLGLAPTTATRLAATDSYTESLPESFATDGNWSFNHSHGTLTVDLTQAHRVPVPVDSNGDGTVDWLNQSGDVEINLGAGKAIVVLPSTGNYQVLAQVGAGSVVMPDGRKSGLGLTRSYANTPTFVKPTADSRTSPPIIFINIRVGAGDIEVRRAAS